jgi:hypothetical protein
MNRTISIIVATLFALSSFGIAAGKDGKISGVISGAHCGVNSMACSIKHDLKRSELPGIYTKDNKFFFVTNVPQSFLSQWPVHEVSVSGKVFESENAVVAKTVSIKDGEKWREVYADGSMIDGMGHRTKLADAVEIDGMWYCGKCATMHKGKGMK